MRARYSTSTLASVLTSVVWALTACTHAYAESVVVSDPQTEGERRLLEWDTTRKFIPLRSKFFPSSSADAKQAQVSEFLTRSFKVDAPEAARRFSTPEFLNNTTQAAKNTVSSVAPSTLLKRLFPSGSSTADLKRLKELPAVTEARRLAGDVSRSALSANSALADKSFTAPEFLTTTAQAAKNTFTTTAAAVSSSTVFRKPFSGIPTAEVKQFVDLPTAAETGRMAAEGYRTYLGPEAEKMKQKFTPGTGPRGGITTGHPLTVEELREILNRNK